MKPAFIPAPPDAWAYGLDGLVHVVTGYLWSDRGAEPVLFTAYPEDMLLPPGSPVYGGLSEEEQRRVCARDYAAYEQRKET